MISFLEGEIVEKAGARVVVDVAGVGYDVMVPDVDARVAATGGSSSPCAHPAWWSATTRCCSTASASPDERELFDLLTG